MTETIERIEKVRKEQHLSRAKMCHLAGIAPTTYSNYIARSSDPKHQTIEAIAKVLKVSTIYLETGSAPGEDIVKDIENFSGRLYKMNPMQRKKAVELIDGILGTVEEIK